MMTLAAAATVLGAVRVLVIVEIALQRYAIGFAQIGAIIAFALLCVISTGRHRASRTSMRRSMVSSC